MGEGEGGAVELLMTQVQISTVPGVKKKKTTSWQPDGVAAVAVVQPTVTPRGLGETSLLHDSVC